jgi:DNA-binding transcriptional LysR family regulator
MRVFQQVVDEGGFAAAARKLDLTPAAVTRLVGDLESHLGVRLLQRTTRRLALTPAGDAYLARLRHILVDIDEADALAQSQSREMSGTVRVLSQPALAVHILAPAIASFQRLHPEVRLELHVQELVDPNVEDYDLTFITGGASLGSTAIVRTITESHGVLCASPEYLRRHGVPQVPGDLEPHRFVRLRSTGARLRPLTLIDPTDADRTVEIEAPSVLTANHLDSLLRATIAGAGIGVQATELVAPILKAGVLQRVLAPWITGRLQLTAAMPSRKYMPTRTRAFLEHVVEHTRRTVADLGAAAREEVA